VTMPLDTIDGVAVVQRQYTRVSPTMFWVTSTAIAGSSSLQARALKRLNTLVRVDIPDMKIKGALTVRGDINLTGTGSINGRDSTPPGWEDCDDAGAPSSGLVGDSLTNITSGGTCTGFTCVSGSPPIDTSVMYADTNTYKNFGGFSYDSLAKLATADKTFDGTSGTTINQIKPSFNGLLCNTQDVKNWGDTSHVNGPAGCREYYPIIWLKGQGLSWTVANYGGQGIILVDGNVTFNGLFQWTGLILVQGTVAFAGAMNAPRIVGGVMAMNRNNGTNSVGGTPKIQFSRCALQAVTARLATARQTKYRSWADMSF
jgi:hypothetical protein